METKTKNDWRTRPPQESVADFKHRIALMIRERETGKKYSIIGAARASACVLRGPDAGLTPSETMRAKKEGRRQ
jgi:hypothetical protein